MRKIEKFMVQKNTKGKAIKCVDSIINQRVLTEPNFNVNMRLFDSSLEYRNIIRDIIKYMKDVLNSSFENYPDPVGISGANVGFPLRIVGVKEEGERCIFMLNPTIVKTFGNKTVKSNCGSLVLKESVSVKRYKVIDVNYYDTRGRLQHDTFLGPLSRTVQHEIDHTNGVLITDRV